MLSAGIDSKRNRLLGLGALALFSFLMLALPATGSAVVSTFSNSNPITVPAGAPGTTIGAADPYPSTINVPVAGTVADATVTLSATTHQNPEDIRVVLQSPNGVHVLLWSDSCMDDGMGSNDNVLRPYTFSDAAAVFLPTAGGACSPGPWLPSGGFGDPNTKVIPAPGPGAPHLNALSFFDGGPANGTWSLWAADTTAGSHGAIGGWSLTLDITPPPPTTPTTPATTIPVVTGPTGQRAEALKRCAKIKDKKKKKKCKKRARLLPN